MKGKVLTLFAIYIIAVMVFSVAASAALTQINYTAANHPGVLYADRQDFMNADMNGIQEDTANFVYQGPAPLASLHNVDHTVYNTSVGYMYNMNVTTTNLGTLIATYGPINYKHAIWNATLGRYIITASGQIPLLHLFPPNPQPPPTAPLLGKTTPAPAEEETTIEKQPIEGWFISFVVSPPGFPSFTGVMVVTYGGFNTTLRAVVPKVIYNATNGEYFKLKSVDVYTIDNPRLLFKKYVAHLEARSLGSNDNAITLYINFTITVTFVKSTKQVIIHEYATYKAHSYCCATLPTEIYYGRIAVVDSNPSPTGCRSFYGWTNFTLPKCSCENESVPVFMVLSWTNTTLDPDITKYWINSANPLNLSYAVYMAAYPLTNFTYAISSVLHDNHVAAVWRALYIEGNYVNLKMDDDDGDGLPDGDMALIRFQWEKSTILRPDVLSGWTQEESTPLTTIVYGVYNINATKFVGGEGGPYSSTAEIYLYDGSEYTVSSSVIGHTGAALPSVWPHPNPSELRFLETGNTTDLNEDMLQKVVSFVDLNNDEMPPPTLPDREHNVPVAWLPVEELMYQLYNAFQGPCFSKLADFGHADFAVTAASIVPADAAGTTWIQGVLQAELVTFDIDLKGAEVFIGAAMPAPTSPIVVSSNWRMPFLLLRVNPVTKPVWLKDMRTTVFATSDKRYFLQMEPLDWSTTPWRDVHYLVASVAGPGPNRVTWYFNDYAHVVFPLTAPITEKTYGADGSLVSTSTVGFRIVAELNGEILPAPTTSEGYAVIAITKDVFNNTGFIVWGLRAADTYWAAYWVAKHYNDLVNNVTYCDKNAIILKIDYGSGSVEWDAPSPSPGLPSGLPLGKPPVPDIEVYKMYDNVQIYDEYGTPIPPA